MKKLYYILLFSFCVYNCQKKEVPFKINSYVKLNIENYEYEGRLQTSVNAILNFIKDDSISQKINKNTRRYEYLLTNRIDLDSVYNLLPDSLKAHQLFNSLLKDKKFASYFHTTFYNNYKNKEIYTKEELMLIASKFFLSEKFGNKFGTRICIGINGLDDDFKHKDFTLLEAFAYEAIFERMMNVKLPPPQFIKNLDQYLNKATASLNENVKDSLFYVRKEVFSAMENDQELENHLLNYFKKNKENLAIDIIVSQ